MEWEFWRFSLGRHHSRNAVRQMLTHAAEYQGWELDRVRIDSDGERKIILRRKVIRMRSTL
ncbi:MAG: hypothetical protein JWP10_1502 [Nocardioidaceae bacterium]|nr:hypothetical protein [Nocardioidaceae bacterium]